MGFLDRYQIIESVGRGGCGEVFLAIDTHLPSKSKCALKRLLKENELKDPETYHLIKERFEAEARILESIEHSQIPELHDFFNEDDSYYLVEEWIDGKTIEKTVREAGRLDPSVVKQIVASLLRILIEIHSKGYIHRDIKPSNIILRSSDKLPVLIDFGVVKEVKAEVENIFGLSDDTTVPFCGGSYTAPEQALKRPVFNSDLFSLAHTAIFCLTTKSPQNLTNPADGSSIWEDYMPEMDDRFVEILNKAIDKNYLFRYRTAQEMLIAINDLDYSEESIESQKDEEDDTLLSEFLREEPTFVHDSKPEYENHSFTSREHYKVFEEKNNYNFSDTDLAVLNTSILNTEKSKEAVPSETEDFGKISKVRKSSEHLRVILGSFALFSFSRVLKDLCKRVILVTAVGQSIFK